ncbi:MAG: BlaI/MecI/CopY family transcriptional regulator [Pirellulales bacterium]
MQKPASDLARAEWVLMEALWARGRGTATDLQKALAADQGWAYSTVKTMLDRLVDKGFVKARRVGNVYEYQPRVKRDSAVSRSLEDVVDRLMQGSVASFVDRLIEDRKLSAQEVSELQDILAKFHDDEPK